MAVSHSVVGLFLMLRFLWISDSWLAVKKYVLQNPIACL